MPLALYPEPSCHAPHWIQWILPFTNHVTRSCVSLATALLCNLTLPYLSSKSPAPALFALSLPCPPCQPALHALPCSAPYALCPALQVPALPCPALPCPSLHSLALPFPPLPFPGQCSVPCLALPFPPLPCPDQMPWRCALQHELRSRFLVIP